MNLYVLVTFVVVVVAAAQELQTSAPLLNTTGYLLNESVRQMNKKIDAASHNIEILLARFDDKLNIVNLNQDSLKDEITRLNSKLDLWEEEDPLKKTCVEKYRSKIPTPRKVELAINSCVHGGRGRHLGLVETAKVILSSAISRKSSFIQEASNCLKHQMGLVNQTTCLTDKIESWRELVHIDFVNLDNELDTQSCLSTSYVKVVQQCVSGHVSQFYGVMNKATYKIESCFHATKTNGACERHLAEFP